MNIQTILITAFALTSANAQEKAADPYKIVVEESTAESQTCKTANISICYEDFSLPLAMAAALQQEQLTDAELYTKVRSALGTDAVRQETFVVLRAKSGQKATVESISEAIYPTEYVPAELPAHVNVASAPPTQEPKNISKTSATPTAFETRNLGFSFEIQSTLTNNDTKLDVLMVPDHVTLVGQSTAGREGSKTEMPIFESQRINTAVQLTLNVPFLLGTMNLPANSKQDPDPAKRVWFTFVKGTVSK